MDIEISKKDHKPLLKRTEIEARIAFQGATPKRKEAIAAVAKATGAPKETIIVRKVLTRYGDQSAKVVAYVYEDRATLEAVEREGAIRKNSAEKPEKQGGEQ